MNATAPLSEGEIYRDRDGSSVRLVRIIGRICCWVPIDKDWGDCSERQYTVVNQFLARFRRLVAAA